jgi:hypothetical protein
VAVADLNGDGRPDVIALSTDADRVDWYENPGWQRQLLVVHYRRHLRKHGEPRMVSAYNERQRGH